MVGSNKQSNVLEVQRNSLSDNSFNQIFTDLFMPMSTQSHDNSIYSNYYVKYASIIALMYI